LPQWNSDRLIVARATYSGRQAIDHTERNTRGGRACS